MPTAKKSCNIPARKGPKQLRPELREFLDNCIIPALVEKYFAKQQKGTGR
ncbi:MAG: hypothetical protein ACLP3K_03180 [Candidatus Acidiferrales bacterium]